MLSTEKYLENVKSLKDGECCPVFWFDGGGGMIYLDKGLYTVCEVQQYGGNEWFVGEALTPEAALDIASTLT